MRHPFDGIIPAQTQPTAEAPPTRRSVLGKLLAAAAGLGAFLVGGKAKAQIATTLAIGEEGATTTRLREEAGPPVTTFAVGEEGSTARLREEGATTTGRLQEEGVTTQAIGEEGVVTTFALGEEGVATTLALGEEGATTNALGEEGATTTALGEEGNVTTQAVGEEGGNRR